MTTQTTYPPVRRTVTVDCPLEQAFETFTERLAAWWPLETHSVGAGTGGRPVTAVFEGRAGGEVYEVGADGRRAHWADVLAWEPPHRLVLAWRVNPSAPAATEIEVRFTAEGARTAVEVVHSGWERLGEQAAETRASYEGGWPVVLGCYERAAGA